MTIRISEKILMENFLSLGIFVPDLSASTSALINSLEALSTSLIRELPTNILRGTSPNTQIT